MQQLPDNIFSIITCENNVQLSDNYFIILLYLIFYNAWRSYHYKLQDN